MSGSKSGPYFVVDTENGAVSQNYGVNVRERFLKDQLQRTLQALEGVHEGTLNRREPIRREMAQHIVEDFLGSVVSQGVGDEKKY